MSFTQTATLNHTGYARADVLVEPEWLRDHLDDPGVRLVEVDVSPAAYDSGRIDGAVLWNVYADLKDPSYATIDGDAFEQLVRRSAIEQDSTVVLYGYAPALGLWLLKYYGHSDVRILNCSREGWLAAGGALSTAPSARPSTSYRVKAGESRLRASLERVRTEIGESSSTIVDVRSGTEFRGECFWPSGAGEPSGRAGHVPTARHLPIDAVFDERGGFRDEAELREVFSTLDLLGGDPIISYCTIGGRASTAWFVLTCLLGRDNVAVYDGSWAEWGHTPGTPVALD